MLFKGEHKIKVSGGEQGLKFGMLSSAFFCEEEKISLKEMTERLKNPTPMTFINCFFAAAKAHNKFNKQEVTFTVETAAEWIDEIGLDKASEILMEAMQVYEEKKTEEEKNALTPEK